MCTNMVYPPPLGCDRTLVYAIRVHHRQSGIRNEENLSEP
jgi:hypothetical protein